jgi:hypothetical protein
LPTTDYGLIGADQDLLVCPGAFEGRFVGRCLHAEVAHVDGVMPGGVQQ